MNRAHLLESFIGPTQLKALAIAFRGEERKFFEDMLNALASRIESMPKIYEQESLGMAAVVHLHYFLGSGDWFITEKDVVDPGDYDQSFGWASLYGSKSEGEAGYISIKELIESGAELDLYWTPKPLKECF